MALALVLGIACADVSCNSGAPPSSVLRQTPGGDPAKSDDQRVTAGAARNRDTTIRRQARERPSSVMTNETVETMIRSGVPLATIVSAIKTATKVDFLIDKQAYAQLGEAGASDSDSEQILEAMHLRVIHGAANSASASGIRIFQTPAQNEQPDNAPVPVSTSVPTSIPAAGPAPRRASEGVPLASADAAAAPANGDLPTDIGVYFKAGSKWWEILPEVVNWKTGGVLKSLATAGIVKGDINGHIPGNRSRNSVAPPLEFIVYTPEGVAITEYQLIHLHEQSESREFRTVTGGILHVSGGATRDLVPFEGKRVAARTYLVLLPNMNPGEYGFLPPGPFSASTSASIGKMYTFHVGE